MKYLKKLLKFLIIFFGLVILLLYITDTDYLLKAVRTIYLKGHTTAYLEDYKEFDNQAIEVSEAPQAWPIHADYNTAKVTDRLDQANKDWGTIAFVIIKNEHVIADTTNGYCNIIRI